MNEQYFSQLLSLFREIQGRITYLETELSPAELSKHFLQQEPAVSKIWESLFLLADDVKKLTETYDNAENEFFLSLSSTEKEKVCTHIIYIANSMLKCYDQLQATAPDKLINSVFLGIEENLEIAARAKQFLISKNLYLG